MIKELARHMLGGMPLPCLSKIVRRMHALGCMYILPVCRPAISLTYGPCTAFRSATFDRPRGMIRANSILFIWRGNVAIVCLVGACGIHLNFAEESFSRIFCCSFDSDGCVENMGYGWVRVWACCKFRATSTHPLFIADSCIWFW